MSANSQLRWQYSAPKQILEDMRLANNGRATSPGRKGASKTMKSASDAVDLMAYVVSQLELNLYDDIGDAMRGKKDVPLRWGCVYIYREFNGTFEQMMNEYIDIRRAEDRRPFLDGPHWEIYE